MRLTKEAAYGALLDNDLIRGLSPDQAQVFYKSGKVVRAKPDMVFISEGAVNKHIYLVLSGEIEVFLPDNENRFSKITLAVRTPGITLASIHFWIHRRLRPVSKRSGRRCCFRYPMTMPKIYSIPHPR